MQLASYLIDEGVSSTMISSRQIHVVGNRTWAIEWGEGLLVMDPGFESSPTLDNLLLLQAKTYKKMSHLFLSHHHYDHADNLPAFYALQAEGKLNFTLVAHEKSPAIVLAKRMNLPYVAIKNDHIMKLAAGDVHVLATPGHTSLGDDISIWIPKMSTLFAGDLPQPQGPSYENCTFHSAFSNHSDGVTVLHSLERLCQLTPELLLMGHEGEALPEEKGLAALEITRRVLERTRHLATRLVKENPGEAKDTYVEWIFDTISWERGMDREKSEDRKCEGHKGACPRLAPQSYYRLYDTHAIEFFVEAALL